MQKEVLASDFNDLVVSDSFRNFTLVKRWFSIAINYFLTSRNVHIVKVICCVL